VTQTCKIQVAVGDSQPREVVIEFEDAEWQLLLDFQRYAAEVGYDRLAEKDIWQTQLKITVGQGKGVTFSGMIPPWDEVIPVLHRLRPLILEREPTYFPKMANLISRRGDDPDFRPGIQGLRDRFSGEFLGSAIQLSLNKEVLYSEAMLKDYLNAFEYHRDADKRAKLEKLFEIIPSDAMRTIVVHLLIDKILAIRGLELIVGLLSGNQRVLRLEGKSNSPPG